MTRTMRNSRNQRAVTGRTARPTGPNAADNRRAAGNEPAHGLFASPPVAPAPGESADAWAAFRAAVVADLAPDGGFEAVLAARAASLLWRLDRATRAAAAAAPDPLALTPDPDTVGPESETSALRQLPPHTPPVYRLARVRRVLEVHRLALARIRELADLLRDRAGAKPLDNIAGLVHVIEKVAGWTHEVGRAQWERIGAALGLAATESPGLMPPAEQWTAKRVWEVVASAAAAAAVPAPKFHQKVLAAVAEQAEQVEKHLRQHAEEESELVVVMRADRVRAAARAPLPDRVAQQESHLGRQMDLTLRQLERLKARRRT